MLNFVKNAFRNFLEVILWLNLIASMSIGAVVMDWAVGVEGRILGSIIGGIVGMLINIIGGGTIATFLNIDKNIEILVRREDSGGIGKDKIKGSLGMNCGNIDKNVEILVRREDSGGIGKDKIKGSLGMNCGCCRLKSSCKKYEKDSEYRECCSDFVKEN